MKAPSYTEIQRMGNSRSNRWGARVNNFFLHTEEGNATAEALANYLNNIANEVSYHYTVRDRIVFDVVDTDYASWSVLDKNPSAINLCFAGSRASDSRATWLRREDDIAIAAWLAVQDCHKYSFSTQVIPPPYARGDGISDHNYVTKCLGIGTHSDVGPNFPWDVFDSYVIAYVTGEDIKPEARPTPPAIRIDQAAAEASWIGKRTSDTLQCPDGAGHFAQFEHGHIYDTDETGAIAVPAHIFDSWHTYGWEAGPLGYPVAGHSVLPEGSDSPLGDVQAFQGGKLYRRFGKPGYWIHGVIGARWSRDGFENGPLGWPTSNEYDTRDEGRAQDFENGTMFWHPSGAVEIRTS